MTSVLTEGVLFAYTKSLMLRATLGVALAGLVSLADGRETLFPNKPTSRTGDLYLLFKLCQNRLQSGQG